MSAEPSECLSELWTRWQGHLINGLYPLGRYLGSSDHSGVFLTRSAARGDSEIAIKLVPADRAVAESLLPRWKRAGGLTHPNLLRLYEWGGCQLEGSPYLYLVMDYADQTLAQLLQSRALTEVEAREMLVPVLDALDFLHGRDLVQGQLKPTNILVKGDQLKLASDTIRRAGDQGPAAHARTLHDAPDALYGAGSPAGDIWALGVSLCEALTRHPPSISGERRDSIALPAELAPSFRDIVVRCLRRRPHDRPALPELLAWAGGSPGTSVPNPVAPAAGEPQPEPAAPPQSAAPSHSVAPSLSAAPPHPPAPSHPAAPPQLSAETHPEMPPEAPRVPLGLILGAALSVAVAWAGWHLFAKRPARAAPSIAMPAPAASASASEAIGSPAAKLPQPATALSPRELPANPAPAVPVHEVIPDVPLSARRTVRGHIKVWVRVVVDQDGSVSAATADRPGPSRYFERLAQQAAKRWTFPPVGASARRLMQIRFDFSRDGARARAVPLH